jgi:2'-5' RNA ligase
MIGAGDTEWTDAVAAECPDLTNVVNGTILKGRRTMAFALTLSNDWVRQGWKVKIRDAERNETPHATILRRRQAWRLSLRQREFLDASPDPGDVPDELVEHVWAQRRALRHAWDAMYPENPVYTREMHA